jgi:translocation and assembly module TamA
VIVGRIYDQRENRLGKLKYASCFVLWLCACFLLSGTAQLFAAEPLEVVIEGISGDELENVKVALALPQGIVRQGQVNTQWLEYFKSQVNEKVKTALEPFGFYAPQITVALESTDNKYFRLVVHVKPGEPVLVIKADISILGAGAGEEKLRKLAEAFPLRKGDVLLQQKYEEAKGDLRAQALNLGYLDAKFEEKKILVKEKEHTATIELALDTGLRYYFGKTTFTGANTFPERFLRRYIAHKEGEVFSYQKIGETQLNIINSERFQEVILSPEKEKAQNQQVPVVAHLKPAPPKHLRIGIGYGTDTGARFSLKYSDLNVLAKGNEIHSELNISQHIQGLGASYVIPSSKNINNFSSIRLDLKREDVTTYETKLLSLELDRSRGFGEGRIGTAYIKALAEESTIASQSPKTFLILPGIQFSQRQYDNLIRPARGFHYSLELRGTHEYLGSDLALLQFVAGGNILIPLPWRLSFFSRIQTGMTLEDKSLEELPASLRFFAGGDKSVRGYDYESLGPKNNKGEVTGGKHLLVASVEVEKALFSDWGIATFYDVGNAFNSLSDLELFQGFGIGLRYYTKVGPIRLDLARRVGVDNPGFKIHFSFGFEL